MKKIATIAATAGLLSAFAGSVQAQTTGTVSFPGTVTSSCNITGSADGVLTENTTPATILNTTTPGTLTVTCNTGASTLSIAQGTHSFPTQPSTPTVAIQFGPAAGTGIYAGATSGTSATDGGDTTSSTGDTANVSSTVTAASPKLLKTGSYTVVVNATLTP
jgi:hypothetical protein